MMRPAPKWAPPDEDFVLLTKVKKSDDTLPPSPPPAVTPPPVRPEEPILLTQRVGGRHRNTLPGFATLVVPDPPLAALRGAEGRDEIATILLNYFSLLARRAALFVMKQGKLVGHDARGVDLPPSTVRHMTIPVTAPSLFRDVISSFTVYRGPMPETPANRAFMQALGGIEGEVMVMPIAVRDRVLALVYADGMIQPFPDAAVHAACREVGLAYERLLLSKRAR